MQMPGEIGQGDLIGEMGADVILGLLCDGGGRILKKIAS
jgi:hypothetical protein